MTSERIRAGVMAGVLAMAATGGAVAALAWRAGDVARPWTASGRAVAGTAGSAATAALLGLGLHLAVAVGWGLLLAAVAHGARGLRLVTLALAVSLLALLVHSSLLPAFRLGYGLGVFPLRGLPLLYLYALQAAALAVGLRLAR